MQNRSTIGFLSKQYKNVLIKCFMAGIMAMSFAGRVEAASTLTDISQTMNKPTEAIGAGNLTHIGNTIFAAIEAGNSTVDGDGVNLTLTGAGDTGGIPNTTLVQGNISVSSGAALALGTEIADSETAIISGVIENNAGGTITAYSNLEVIGNLTLNGNKATFEKDLTVTAVTAIGSGINIFNGKSTFKGSYTEAGDATFNAETIFNGIYSNTGTSTFANKATFEQEYTGAGTLNVFGGQNATNFAGGYNSAGTLNVGDAVTGASGTVTIGDYTAMNINTGGSLNIVNGTVDVSNGNLIVDSGATFATGVNGVLKAKASDFAIFTDVFGVLSVSDLLGENVEKQLDNDGRLILTGQNGSMKYNDYKELLGAIINGGTLLLENVNIDTASLYLEDVASGTDLQNNVVLGNDASTGKPNGGAFAAGKTAILSGVNGNMNNLGTLTLTGDASGVLAQGNAINSVGGTLTLQNGIVTGFLTNNGTVNINGQTTISGALTNAGSLNVKNGSFVANGEIILNGGTLRVTNANSGNSIDQASSAFLNKLNAIGGHIIAEQNSYIVLGPSDINTAINIFAESNHDWGTGVTAALFILKPQTLASTGSIKINGKNTVIDAASANEASFASNSLLVVDAQGLGSDAAITSSRGKLTVESGAKLHITNVQNNQIVNIVTGFTEAAGAIADGGWEGDNLTSSSGVQSVKVADFVANTGSYSVQVFGSGVDGILKNFNQMQVKTARILTGVSPDVNSADIPTQFLSRATDSGYLGTNNPRKATATIEGMAQAAGVLGVSATTLDVAKTVAGVIASKLGSISQNTAKNMPSGDDNRLQGLSPWVMPLYNYTSVNGYSAGKLESDYTTSMGGVAFGADKAVDDYRLGVAFNVGIGSTEASGGFDGNNELDFYGASIYGSKNIDDIKITADAGLTYTNNSLKQYLGALAMSDAKADVNSYALSIGAMAEKTFEATDYTYTPYAGLRLTSIYTESYKMKSGGGVISNTKSDNQNILQIPVGVAFETQIEDYKDWSLKPKAKAGIIASIGELKASANTTFAGVGNAKYNMDNVDALAFDGGIGLEMQKDNITVDFGYNLLASPHEYSHSLSANVKWDF